jgi:hypothetical protein
MAGASSTTNPAGFSDFQEGPNLDDLSSPGISTLWVTGKNGVGVKVNDVVDALNNNKNIKDRNSMDGVSSEEWSQWAKTMGGATVGFGYCSVDEPVPGFAGLDAGRGKVPPSKSWICSCVNSPMAKPGCYFPYCTGQMGLDTAFKPEASMAERLFAREQCPAASFYTCQQWIAVKGNNDTITATDQVQDCGGTQNFITNNFRERPGPTIAMIVMVVAVIVLGLTLRGPGPAPGGLPPPETLLALDAAARGGAVH